MYKKTDEYYMDFAIKEALKAKKKKEVPVGAIIVQNNKIIAKAHNKIEKNKCSINHAEIIAIKKANKKNNNWRLDDCIMYTTMEPCMMCCGAIQLSRIKKIVYGVKNKKYGYTKKMKNFEIIGQVKEEECLKIIQNFFEKIR